MDFNICIIGAGVVGLATARQLSIMHKGIILAEENRSFGEETSSRNSEVIHSGIYYPTGTLKAVLSNKGNRMLYDYCTQKQIPHRQCGKLIVATHAAQLPQLGQLHTQGINNGVEGIRKLTKEEIIEIEPAIFAEEALFIPSTGIIDSYGLMKNLFADAVSGGVDFVFQTKVCGIQKINHGYKIQIREANGSRDEFTAGAVINCAGLGSSEVAGSAGIDDAAYRIHFCKGEYFRLAGIGQQNLNHLVYPVPDPNLTGLGIHATISLDGSIKLGPNVIYLKENVYDYSVEQSHKKEFFEAALSYLPFLEEKHLEPEMAGIRPKLQAEGEGFRDFVIQNEALRGYPGFINLIGIESPGLTSCMSIASYVDELLHPENMQ